MAGCPTRRHARVERAGRRRFEWWTSVIAGCGRTTRIMASAVPFDGRSREWEISAVHRKREEEYFSPGAKKSSKRAEGGGHPNTRLDRAATYDLVRFLARTRRFS